MAKLSRKKVLRINTSPGGRFQAVVSWSQNDCFAWKGALFRALALRKGSAAIGTWPRFDAKTLQMLEDQLSQTPEVQPLIRRLLRDV